MMASLAAGGCCTIRSSGSEVDYVTAFFTEVYTISANKNRKVVYSVLFSTLLFKDILSFVSL